MSKFTIKLKNGSEILVDTEAEKLKASVKHRPKFQWRLKEKFIGDESLI